MLLTNEGKKEFLANKFHQFFDITISNTISENIQQFVNFTLSLEKINEFLDLTQIQDYFNDNYNNVIFTAANDDNQIYQYEFYEGVYFIRLQPFSNTVRMHIIPKKYDASETQSNTPILFFKDNKQDISNDNFSCTSHYERKTNKKTINSYYKQNTKKTSNAMYTFDIKKYTKNLKKLQINMGYSYNNTNPTNEIIHYIGVLDTSDENGNPISPSNFTEFNSTLMDANLDNVGHFTNTIIQQSIDNGIEWPTFPTITENLQVQYNTDVIQIGDEVNLTAKLIQGDKQNKQIKLYSVLGFNNEHSINTKYHKTIKYFNDDMYTEENGKYLVGNWIEGGS